jgi:hypothetical protein
LLSNIDENRLITLAGARAFARGLLLFENRRVRNLTTDEARISAGVEDDQCYSATIRPTPRTIDGVCDCAESDGIDFCRHCVAVALAAQAKADTAKPITKKRGMTAVRRYLSGLSREELQGEFMALIHDNPKIRRELLEKVQLASNTTSFAVLRTMIENAVPREDLWDVRAIEAAFCRFDAMLAKLLDAAERIGTVVFLRATEYAIRCFNDDLATLDDFGDFHEHSREKLRELHQRATSRLDWGPADLIAYLIERSIQPDWHPFSDEPYDYVLRQARIDGPGIMAAIDARLAEQRAS